MTTRATMHYLAIYQDILENYTDDELCIKLTLLDEIAETCLTTSELFDYCKQTRDYWLKSIGE